MGLRFDIGDMVLITNRKSPYWNHSGLIQDSEFDSETEKTTYLIAISEDVVKKFDESELTLDEQEEVTEILD